MARRFLVQTLGCKANLADGQALEAELARQGWLPASGTDDPELELCVVNSCTVTDEADRQSRRLATRLARDNPRASVVFTGCAAEVDPEAIAATPGVRFVVGNQDKARAAELIVQGLETDSTGVLGSVEGYEQMLSRHPMDREWPEVGSLLHRPEPGERPRTRAFLKVQDGCDSFCTYCVIPYGRGPSRSLSIEQVVSHVQGLVESGVREVVITGINIGEYGADWANGAPQVEAMIETILVKTRLERLRLSSLDPTEISPRMTELMAGEPRFCPHFHVSLQSASSPVLRLMKRKYAIDSVEECLNRVAAISNPSPFVGMDVITGFPGETEREFEATRERLAILPWSRLHVFPYSERSGTPATRLPGVVPRPERARRAEILRGLSLERLVARYRTRLDAGGRIENVLVENPVRGPDGTREWVSGYAPDYTRVLARAPKDRQRALWNQLISARPIELIIDRAAGDVAFLAES